MELGSMLAAASSVLLLLVLSILWWRQITCTNINLPPGPRSLPIFGNLHHLGKIKHQWFYLMSKQYGPMMSLRLGSVPVIIVSSAEAARQFLKVHDHNFSNRPYMTASKLLGYGPVAITYSHKNRADLKKLLTVHLLSAKRVEESRPIRVEEEALLVKALMEDYEHNRVTNLLDRVCKCTMNIATRLVINRRLSFDDIDKFPPMVDRLTALLGTFLIGDYIPYLGFLDLISGTKSKIVALHKQLDAFLEHVIATYRHEKELHPAAASSCDILDVLLSLSSPNCTEKEINVLMDDKVIKALILDMFVAGFRTSMMTIHWAMAQLLRHPTVMEKAQQELDQVVGTDRMVAETDLHNLSYLHAVVKETLRLHPPAPLMLPHESTESCKVNGYDVPKKTRVFVNLWAIGRDPLSWENPLQFDPERFVRNSHIDFKGHHYELIPFGAGRRACPGLNSGVTNVSYTLATLLHAFDWALPNGLLPEDLDMSETGGLGLIKSKPVLAIPTPRLPKHLYNQ